MLFHSTIAYILSDSDVSDSLLSDSVLSDSDLTDSDILYSDLYDCDKTGCPSLLSRSSPAPIRAGPPPRPEASKPEPQLGLDRFSMQLAGLVGGFWQDLCIFGSWSGHGICRSSIGIRS